MEFILGGLKVIVFILGAFIGGFIGRKILLWHDDVVNKNNAKDLLLIKKRCRDLHCFDKEGRTMKTAQKTKN